ncbi:MAG: hypothetical protein IPK46_15080 [Saprospiraceae bacterium]|nr:hypothetical protein [Saprospiraceae bacterium]
MMWGRVAAVVIIPRLTNELYSVMDPSAAHEASPINALLDIFRLLILVYLLMRYSGDDMMR